MGERKFISGNDAFAEGIRLKTPSTIPRPARKIGTKAIFLPARTLVLALIIGVFVVTSRRGRSRVDS